MLFREFSATWIRKMTFRKKPNLCPKCLVLAGSSFSVLKKQPPDRNLTQRGELCSQASRLCCGNRSCKAFL